MKIEIQKLDKTAVTPTKAYSYDAGWDIYAVEDMLIGDGETVKIKTGIAMAIPQGWFGLICDRSSMGSKGIKVMGGVIDSSYRGEVLVCLCNTRCLDVRTPGGEGLFITSHQYTVKKGDKIAQMVFLPVPEVSMTPVRKLNVTERDVDGFGSTGR